MKQVQTTPFIEMTLTAGSPELHAACAAGVIIFVKMKQTVVDGP